MHNKKKIGKNRNFTQSFNIEWCECECVGFNVTCVVFIFMILPKQFLGPKYFRIRSNEECVLSGNKYYGDCNNL